MPFKRHLFCSLGILTLLFSVTYGQTNKLSPASRQALEDIANTKGKKYLTEDLEQWLEQQKSHVLHIDSKRSKQPLANKHGVNIDALLRRYNKTDFAKRRSADSYPNLLVLVSLSMPETALVSLLRNTAKVKGRVLIRGMVAGNNLKQTVLRIRKLITKAGGGQIDIDPRPFRTFTVKRVPTFVVTKVSYSQCRDTACKDNPPLFDKIEGNISLRSALETIAQQGDVKEVANRYVKTLEGGQ